MSTEVALDFSKIAPPRPILTPEQCIARDAVGNTMVIAAPGTGKTEICRQRAEDNLHKGIKTLVLFFTIAACTTLKRRCPGVEAYTIHSYCYHTIGWYKDYPDLLYRFIKSEPKEEWDEVIVDEGQDLSPLMLDVVLSIPKKNLFIVGDPFQAIYINNWASNLFDGPALGEKVFEELSSLCTQKEVLGNRRSSPHIVNLLEGIYPRNMYSACIKDLDTTAIFARWHKELQQVSELLKAHNIAHILIKKQGIDSERRIVFGKEPLLSLMVAHQSKGRQFHKTITYDWQSYTKEDHNLLYTTVGRASEEAYIVPVNHGIATRHLPGNTYIKPNEVLNLVQ